MGEAITAWLSAAEIEALTGRKRHSAQARKLAEMRRSGLQPVFVVHVLLHRLRGLPVLLHGFSFG